MTQLALGLDRDSAIVAGSFDERDPAVKKLLSMAIKACKDARQICRHLRPGPQRPPGLRRVAGREGIDSVSLNPDTVVDTWLRLAASTADDEVSVPARAEVN